MLRNRSCAALLAGLAVAAILGGCRESNFGSHSEMQYIREDASRSSVPKGTGPLWPFSPGRRWEMVTHQFGGETSASAIVDEGVKSLPDGRTGEAIFSYRAGKLYRVEFYQTDPAGNLDLLALGDRPDDLILFTPAIPVVRSPVTEGQSLTWSGTALFQGAKLYATAFHRIGGVEQVKTPFETLDAYRLDGTISVLEHRSNSRLPEMMWFVPGKGPAQRRLANRGAINIEIITRFTP